ncbi:vitamin D3 hydroxylase-associated protein-like isoform X1 [Rhinatrema bivittatum]|uniref:vitamin D3 hydroxylase-associated protein-like isoform X1 n=1 Tax=Rhinatrema bivittatum TaxID=194408 RepID=UPI00112E1459|nr:vitamin D3 hydroxylase-associated protein-like isoform X1 [Rhinatrema bivittatum]
MLPTGGPELLSAAGKDPAGILAAVICGSATAFLALRWLARKRIQKKIEEARKKRDDGLQELKSALLKFKEQRPGVDCELILTLSLLELTEKLREGSLSPESVLYTYLGKTFEVNEEVNCVTAFLPDCGSHLQAVKEQNKEGLLYGVPVSLKEHIGYKGQASPCGLTYFLGVPEKEDSVIVQVLKRQGAVPFVKTNVSQSTISYDCSNSIFGQTLNPLNHRKTPGGSSGGEGALIAGGGSILGIGSDTGGSIRLPSSFCGLCGLKPTAYRLSLSGVTGPMSGMLSVPTMLGPMARDVDSLVLCMKALLCDHMFCLDPTVPPIPFRDELYSRSGPLKIGYYGTDSFFLPPPSMRRAFQETKELLEEAGHKLVSFVPPRVDYALNELFIKGIFADGGSALLEKFDVDVVDSSLKQQVFLYKLPRLVKRILAFFLKPVFPRLASNYKSHCGVRSVEELWRQHAAVQTYCQEFITEWQRLDLDVLLCPMLGPAFNIGYPGKLFAAISYTMLYNVLNFPAGVVPVTRVTREDEEELRSYEGHYGDSWDRLLKEAVEGGVGLPVAVQCVALPWQEELCLRFMKEVERLTWEKREME